MNEEIKSYDIPNTEGVTPDEAAAILDRVYAEASNPKHPYTNKHHPQNKDFLSAVTRLHEIKTEGSVSPTEKICQEALDGLVVKQNKLVAEAEKELELLVDLGFEPADVPDDIKPFQVRGLTEQRLHAEGDFKSLMPMLEKDLRDLRDYKSLEVFQNFQATPIFDEELVKDVLEKVIFKISELNKQKYGLEK
jgi:hypothetical protein